MSSTLDSQGEQFVLKYIDRQFDAYEEENGGYEKEFEINTYRKKWLHSISHQ